MNREKAIDLLDNLIGMVEDNQESDYYTALKMGIQALSQEPQCTEHPCLGTLCRYYKEPCRVKNELSVELNELKPYEDVISREMALKECHDIVVDGERYRVIQEETLLGLPPVTPSCDKCAMNGSGSKYCDNCKQKSGKWIPVSERLPELKQRVLVSYETMDDGKKVDITTYDKYGFSIGKAHAWMPLPKPYEPQESEEQE